MAFVRREDQEDREVHHLSVHAQRARDAARRREESPDPLRTAFQRDRDRVIHSTAFRRLQHKTQVVAAFVGDHYRSRMTHSLEVAQMARSVAAALRLNADLAEAIALAHDLGHPPFGHVGEEALHELVAEHGGFRHNAQGSRIVDLLEDRSGDDLGLNLTWPMRRALLKGRIPAGFPLADDLIGLPGHPPLEARVVDLCDRIAYLCHDLDDGLRAGVFAQQDAAALRLWQAADTRGAVEPLGRRISAMIGILVDDLVRHTAAGWSERSEVRPKLGHSESVTVLADELLAFLRERFYRSRQVLDVMEDGSARIRTAFARFRADPDQLPPSARARLEKSGIDRVACDHVAGMTDRYLLRITSDGSRA
jgi:dGTPase